MPDEQRRIKEDTAVMDRPKVTPPPMFNVILHNDDYTTKLFVVDVLVSVFHKNVQEAHELMMHIHNHGRGVAGTYIFEVAETKVTLVTDLAREAGFPLKATFEAE